MTDEMSELEEVSSGRLRHSLFALLTPVLNLAMLAMLALVAWYTWRTREDIRAQQFELALNQHQFAQENEARAVQAQKLRNLELAEAAEERRRRIAENPGAVLPTAQAIVLASGYLTGDQRLTTRNLAELKAFREGQPAIADAPVGFSSLVEGLLRLEQFESEDFPGLEPAVRGRLFQLVINAEAAPSATPASGPGANLVLARRAFRAVLGDVKASALHGGADAGLARTHLIIAQAAAFTTESCAPLVERAPVGAALPTTFLLSRAECLRKVGRTRESHEEFAHALEQLRSAPASLQASREWAELAYQGEHGWASTLIPLRSSMEGQERLDTAEAGLRRAAALRERAGETLVEQTYSLENIGFIQLRRGDLNAAISHAKAMDAITPFLSWSLTVWALAADELGQRDEASRDARQRLRLFPRSGFNECELRRLLPEKYGSGLDAILAGALQDVEPQICPETQSSDYAGRG